MSEQSPTHFDPTAVSEALHTPGQSTTDLAFGTGQRYEVAAGHLSLEIFPGRPLTRITTAAARVELFDTPPPRVVNDQAVIKRETAQEPRQTWQEEATLTVSPEGTVVFGYVHRPATPAESDSSPAEPATAPQQPQEPLGAAPAGDPPAADLTPPTSIRPPVDTKHRPGPDGSLADTPLSAAADGTSNVPVAFDGDAAPASGTHTADTSTREQQPRVQLTGRLGRDPSFRTSPRGTLVGRFPLAVHQKDGSTTWHSILAFGDRAKLLQHRSDAGELSKGQEVSLVGYQHTREQSTREGTKTVTEIYAVAVTRR